MTTPTPTDEQLRALWDACTAWRDEHKPWSPGDIWVVCDVKDDAFPDLLEAVCDVIGYCECPPCNLRLVLRDAYGEELDLTERVNLRRGMRFYMAHDDDYTWTPECDWTPTIFHRWTGIDEAIASPEDVARFKTAEVLR